MRTAPRAPWARVAIGLAAIVAASGCKSSPPEAAYAVTGAVTLPAGSSLSLASLRVSTSAGSASVASDGSFRAPRADEGLALAMLRTADGTPFMLSFLDPGAAGAFSAKETATTLLLYSTGAFLWPRQSWPDVLALIRADPATDELAAVVAARLAADPAVLVHGDAAIQTALATATQALQAGAAQISLSPSGGRLAAFNGNPTEILVQDQDPEGLACAPAPPAADGIAISNLFRRHIYYFVYRTGYQPEGGAVTPLEPWVEVGKGYLMATTGPSTVIGTIVDRLTGNLAWAPIVSDPIDLARTPDTAVKTFYEAIVVGPGAKDVSSGPFASSPLMDTTWKPMQSDMMMLSVAKDVLLPVLFSSIGFATLEKGVVSDEVNLAIGLCNTLIQGGVDVAAYVEGGNLTGLLQASAKAITGNATLQKEIGGLLGAFLLKAAPKMSAAEVEKLAENVSLILAAFDAGLLAIDLGGVGHDYLASAPYTSWEIVATNNVHLTPASATVSPGGTVTLTESHGLVAGAESDFMYHYTTPGAYGVLRGGGAEAADLWVAGAKTVEYVAHGDAVAGSHEDVTVEAVRIQPGGNKSMGTAKSTVTIGGHYVLSRYADGTGAIGADDDLVVYVNGTPVYDDSDCHASDHPPIALPTGTQAGDVVRVELYDCTGSVYMGLWGIHDVYLSRDGQSALVTHDTRTNTWFYASGARVLKHSAELTIPF